MHAAAELACFMRALHCETTLKQVLATRTKSHCSSSALGKVFFGMFLPRRLLYLKKHRSKKKRATEYQRLIFINNK